MEWTSCNLCGSDNTSLYCQGRDWQLGGQKEFRLVRCRECGLIYLNPRPAPGEMGRYYPAAYEPFTRFGDSQGSRLARWGYARYIGQRCKKVTHLKAPGRLLDVGCATGEFLARIRDDGWLVEGVEISPAAAEAARRDYGLTVHDGDLRQAGLPAAHLDAVTLWDVLEHTHDPSAELAEIWRLLKDGGLLFIELPNARSLDAALFGRYWIGLDMPRHLYVFSPGPLRAMLQQCGFRVISRRCSSGGYGAFARSLSSWAGACAPAGVQTLVGKLLAGPLLQFGLLPYIYLAYGLGLGPEATVVCEKIVE